MSTAPIARMNGQRGVAMVVVLGVLLALSLLTMAVVRTSDVEMSITGQMTRKTQAFLAAEAGMARANYIFTQHPYLTASDSLTRLINTDTLLPNAHFRVAMDSSLPVRKVIALGHAGTGVSAIQVLYRHGLNPVNIWNNAIFAGHGQNGLSISGNVGIHGSVHILGDGEPFQDANGNGVRDPSEPFTDSNHDGIYDGPLAPDAPALDMTGTATISNNYDGLRPILASRLPGLPTSQVNGETVETLQAELRVQHGTVLLDGNAKVGQPDASGGTPAVKETMDGVYVSDGFSGSSADQGVYSDNGFGNTYDLGGAPVEMPNLDEPFTDKSGSYYPTYMQYLKSNALVIHGDLELQAGVTMPRRSNGNAAIYLDEVGNLQISGIVYVEGDIRITQGATARRHSLTKSRTIQYDGRGTLVSSGNTTIDANVIPKNQFATNDVLGVISYKNIHIGEDASHLALAGAFYAQEEVINAKQNQIAGSIVSNYFGMSQVPDIFQVPELAKNLPPGMPGADDIILYSWRRVPRSWVELD